MSIELGMPFNHLILYLRIIMVQNDNFVLFLIFEVQLIYNVVLISTVQQSESYIYVYMCKIFFCILFHYGLSLDIEYNSLCYTIRPCCLFILCIVVCICKSQTPPNPSSIPLPLGNHSLFSVQNDNLKTLPDHVTNQCKTIQYILILLI